MRCRRNSTGVLLARLPRADGHFSVRRILQGLSARRQFPAAPPPDQADRRDRRPRSTRYVGKPLIRTALAMMRQPARLAGMSARCRISSSAASRRSARCTARRNSCDTIDTRETEIHGGDHRRRDRSLRRSAAVPTFVAARRRGVALARAACRAAASISRSIVGFSMPSSSPSCTSSLMLAPCPRGCAR